MSMIGVGGSEIAGLVQRVQIYVLIFFFVVVTGNQASAYGF